MININERYAIAKLSEHLTSINAIEGEKLRWLSTMFNIIGYQNKNNPQVRLLLFRKEKEIEKDTLFNFLLHVYENYPNIFPKLMEEMLRECLKDLLKIAEKEEYKERVEIVKNTIASDLEILGYEMQINFQQTMDFLNIRLISRKINDRRKTERSKLFNILEEHFKNEYESLKGAY